MNPYRQQNNKAMRVLLSGQSGKVVRGLGELASEHTGGAWPVAALGTISRGKEKGTSGRAAPITFELAISTWLTVEDFAGALSQGSLVLRSNGGLAWLEHTITTSLRGEG
jgi:hypothetical protein